MCGLTGYIQSGAVNISEAKNTAARMAQTISHRGPDDSGVWVDEQNGVVLAHRRLAVIDLSPAGHQPMVSASGRFVIAFNGEIYNHLDLRAELVNSGVSEAEGIGWRGHSDTESLLAGIDRWGLKKALQKAVGMFALALWDREARKLILARDRMGEKPLYYGWQGDVFLFGSELKSLRAHPAFENIIDRDAIALYLRHNQIPAPYTIYRGIRKLMPGSFLEFNYNGEHELSEPETYWSMADVVEAGLENPFLGNEIEATTALDDLLSNAVRVQMNSDVPLGAFLSGGIDSTIVVALMQAQSVSPVRTFTIGFNESGYNEAVHAKAVAKHLGTEHTELYFTPEQALGVIPRLPTLYDEPFADSSQIPTFLISELARQHSTVSLTGDGGDELFGGYNRYTKTEQWWSRIRHIPLSARQLASKLLLTVDSRDWERIGSVLASVSKDKNWWSNLANNVTKLAQVLQVEDTSMLYRHFISHWRDPSQILIDGKELGNVGSRSVLQLGSITEQMMMADTLSYLPDDILVKVDRAAMGVSLETRIPMLDHRIVEFAWKLPLTMKVRNGQGKWILRQVLNRYVPTELIERPKMGFGVPIDSWLRGPLREWAESLLDESRLQQEGFFNPAPIRRKWEEHISCQRNWQYHLWDILMFQSWLEEQGR